MPACGGGQEAARAGQKEVLCRKGLERGGESLWIGQITSHNSQSSSTPITLSLGAVPETHIPYTVGGSFFGS